MHTYLQCIIFIALLITCNHITFSTYTKCYATNMYIIKLKFYVTMLFQNLSYMMYVIQV